VVQGTSISGISDLSNLESLFLSESNNAPAFHSKINLLADDMGQRCIPSVLTVLDGNHKETLIGSEAVKSSIRRNKSCVYHSPHLISLSQHNASLSDNDSLDRDRFHSHFRSWKERASAFGMHKTVVMPSFDDEEEGDDQHPDSKRNEEIRPHLKLRYRIKDSDGNFKEYPIDFAFVSMLQKISRVISAQTASKKLHVVSAVPRHWTSAQIEHLKALLLESRLNPLQIIRQHSAAILSLNLDNHRGAQRVLCIDFGTFRSVFSVVNVVHGFVAKNHPQNVHSETDDVSGMAVDGALIKWLVRDFQTRNRGCFIEMEDSKSRLKLFKELTRIKGVLSAGSNSVRFDIESLSEGIDYHFELSRAKFESIIYDEMRAIPKWVESTMKAHAVDLDAIDHVVASGGLAEMPKVQQALSALFGDKLRTKALAAKGIPSSFVTVYGCAVEAASLSYLTQFQRMMQQNNGHQALRNVVPIPSPSPNSKDAKTTKGSNGKQEERQTDDTEAGAVAVAKNAFLDNTSGHRIAASSKRVSLCLVVATQRKPLCVIEKMTPLPMVRRFPVDAVVGDADADGGDIAFAVDVVDDDCKSVLETMEQPMNGRALKKGTAQIEVAWDQNNGLSVTVGRESVQFEIDDAEEENASDDDDDAGTLNASDSGNDDTLDID